MFRVKSTRAAGRGLYATRDIAPGTEICTEKPAYAVSAAGKAMEQEGLESLAAHIVASNADRHRQAISQLVSNVDELKRQVPRKKAVEAAVMPVRALVGRMPVEHALSIVTSSSSTSANVGEDVRNTVRTSLLKLADAIDLDRVWLAYGRDWSNAMDVYSGTSSERRGSGLYPCYGAVMNHSNRPNCNLVFDEDWTLHVRSVVPIAAGEKLCHAYMDLGRPYSQLRAELRRKYGRHSHARTRGQRDI